jgi:outer membrane scaffolding protein for murein synthesis (MipA/OmpV family)
MAGPSPINFIVRTRKHLKAGQGTQADLRLTAGVFQAGPFSAGLVAGATWASARATGSIYDIPPQQAAAIGLPAFTAGAGWLSNSLGVIGSFDLARHWQLVGNLEGRRLRGDAARSPLAERGSNLTTTLGAACRF